MIDQLVRDALANVWCSPYQDRQTIIKLARHTPGGGVRRNITLQWETESLPTERDYYHVYGIGRNSPQRLNLDDRIGIWIPLSALCEQQDLVSEIYTEDGKVIPRTLVYVKRTINKGYLFAIKIKAKLPNLDTEAVYIRLYSNAYFNSTRFTDDSRIKNNSLQIETVAGALPLQWAYHQHLIKEFGTAYAFLNGDYIDDFKPMDLTANDHVEWFYDASIREIVEFRLDDLKTFTSALDQQKKYLLHPPKGSDTIDYFDDCDLFIVKKQGARYRGRYVHRNTEKTLRQVTHNDYAVSVLTIQRFIDLHPNWHDTSDLYLRLHIRHSGYRRPLVDEHHRIRELYKLTDNEIIRAMVGIDSTLPEWRAATLENSNYVRIMRSYYSNVTPNMVVDAYGYNALVKALADTPIRVIDGGVRLPPALSNESTLYEYNTDGVLLGFYTNVNREIYIPNHVECSHVEGIVGIGSLTSGLIMGNAPYTLDDSEEYRFYVSSINTQGIPIGGWRDVTGDSSKYNIQNGRLTWILDPAGEMGAVKGTSNFVSYSFPLAPLNGCYRFTMNHQIPGNVLPIPPAVLDVWLNGRALVENVDFYVNFPEIVIVNKRYLSGVLQQVTVRAYGFCDANFKLEQPTDIGFVTHNTISLNNTYNIRDDKVIRCVVGGRVLLRQDLQFAEDNRLVDVPKGCNGTPYVISDIPQPLRGIIPYSNYMLRSRSIDLDNRVADYLSDRLPELEFDSPATIPDRYNVYSPYLTNVLHDLSQGLISPMRPGASDQEVLEYLTPYRDLLKYEPAIKDSTDLRFVSIHAHPYTDTVAVSEAAYRFLERVIKLTLRNNVTLTHSVQIEVG